MAVDITRKGVTSEKANTTNQISLPIYNACTDYVTRNNLEEQIHSAISDDNIIGAYISGFHGVGKTTVVKKAVCDIKERFDNIYYITLPFNLGNDIGDMISCLTNEIEKCSSQEFEKKNIEKSFLGFISRTNSCIIVDDFDLPVCQKFLLFLSTYQIKSKFILISKFNMMYYQSKLHELDSYMALDSMLHQIIVTDFSKEEAKKYIRSRLKRKRVFNLDSFDYIVNTLIRMDILNPYELVLVASYIENNFDDSEDDFLDDFTLQYDDINTYDMILSLVNKIWGTLSDEAKTMVYYCSFVKSGTNIPFFCRKSDKIKKMRTSIAELEKYNLILKVDRGGVYATNALTRQALSYFVAEEQYQLNYEEYYNKARELWIDTCQKIVESVGDCYTNLNRLRDLDVAGGIAYIQDVVFWCFDDKRYQEAISVARNASYYFYVRGEGASIERSIEMCRFRCAQAINDVREMHDALTTQLNILSKRNHLDEAKNILKKLQELQYDMTTLDEIVKYKHAYALYYFSNKDYQSAYDIWNELYQRKDELRSKDYCTVSRWICECMKCLNMPREKIMYILNETLEYAVKTSSIRDELQCILKLTDLSIDGQIITHTNFEEFLALEPKFVDVGDTSFLAQFYYIKYKASYFLGLVELARDAIHQSKQFYESIFDEVMVCKIDHIIAQF